MPPDINEALFRITGRRRWVNWHESFKPQPLHQNTQKNNRDENIRKKICRHHGYFSEYFGAGLLYLSLKRTWQGWRDRARGNALVYWVGSNAGTTANRL